MNAEVYAAKVIYDSIERSRVLVVWGRGLVSLRPNDQGDAERMLFKGRYRVAVDIGGLLLKRQKLPLSGRVDWSVDRCLRFLIPETVYVSDGMVWRLMLDSGEYVPFEVTSAISSPERFIREEGRLYVPQRVSKKNPLIGKVLDLRGYGGSEAAITFEDADAGLVSDVDIIYPHGQAFAFAHRGVQRGARIQRVYANVWSVSGYDFAGVSDSVIDDVVIDGVPGWRAGPFGLLLSGGGNLVHRLVAKNLSRGPIYWPKGDTLARECMTFCKFSDIVPTWGESETLIRECQQCEYPLAVSVGAGGCIFTMRLRSRIAPDLVRPGSHLSNPSKRRWANIIASRKINDLGDWEVEVDRPIDYVNPGDCRAGMISVENYNAYTVVDRCKSFTTLSASADNEFCCPVAFDCEEPMESFRTLAPGGGPVDRPGEPYASDHPFSWRDVVKFPYENGCIRKAITHVGNRTAAIDPKDPRSCYRWGWPGEKVEGIGWT